MSQTDLRLALILAIVTGALMVLEPRLPPFMRQANRVLGTVVGLWLVFLLYLFVFRFISRTI